MALDADIVAAVQKNDAERVRGLLDQAPALIRTTTGNGSLLLTAAFYGADKVVPVLRDRHGELDVHEAATLGDAARLRAILDERPDRVTEPSKEGFTPLGLAAFFGHPDAVRVLLEKGAPIDDLDRSRFANTALDAAAAANHADVVRVLLAAGANANVRASGGMTPLHKAAMNGNREIVAALLERGADPAAVDAKGKTPLDYAREKGASPVADLLRTRA